MIYINIMKCYHVFHYPNMSSRSLLVFHPVNPDLADLLRIFCGLWPQFFFQNSLGLPYLYQSLNNFEFFFIRIPSGDNTSIDISIVCGSTWIEGMDGFAKRLGKNTLK